MAESENTIDLARRWRDGDEAAAADLFQRFSDRVWRLADRQLNRKLKRRVTADTILIGVFDRVLRGIQGGRYTIDRTGDLWRLLYRITITKILQNAEFHTQDKRNFHKEQSCADGADSFGSAPVEAVHLDRSSFIDFRIDLDDVLSRCKERTRQMARMCLEGHSTEEIARALGCSRWTVKRNLDGFGDMLRRRLDSSVEDQ